MNLQDLRMAESGHPATDVKERSWQITGMPEAVEGGASKPREMGRKNLGRFLLARHVAGP